MNSLKIKKFLKSFFIYHFVILGGFFFSAFTYADDFSPPTSQYNYLGQGIRHILDSRHYDAAIGIYVQSLQTGRVYFSKNAQSLLAPASIQKLITVSAALLFLKPTFQFTTSLFKTGSIDHGVLNGNLYVQFSGDPSLKRSDLFALLSKLKTKGIEQINGNVIIDDNAFDHIPYPPGWAWDDLSYDYAAPLRTIVIDRNRFSMRFAPSRVAGAHAILSTNLPNGVITIFNHVRTTRYRVRHCPVSIYSNDRNQFAIHGCLLQSAGKQSRALAVRNMLPLAKAYVDEALKNENIAYIGKIKEAKTPLNSVVLAQHDSAPLSQLIMHLLKKSDNLYANALLKKMGAVYFHRPGSWQNGLAAEKAILLPVGLNISNVRLNDGAGLSRYNYVTPLFMSKVLWTINRNATLKKYLVPALPIAGVDGTLIYRMSNLGKQQCLRAKTGSTDNISSLAGFVRTKNHGLVSFVVIANNFVNNRYWYVSLENKIGEYLYHAP